MKRRRVVRLVALNLNPRDLSIGLVGLKQFANLDPIIRAAYDIRLHQWEKNYARMGETDTLEGLDVASLVDALDPSNTDLVGFSTYVWNFEFMVALARRLKEHNPRLTTLFGGSQAGGYGARLLKEHRQADFVIRGEAERSFREFLRGRLDGDVTGVPNLFYRVGSEVRTTVPSDARAAKKLSYLDSIEELPYPFRDPEYRNYLDGLEQPVTAQFETERGCPLSCAYCSWGTRLPVRRRRQADVEEGLTYLLNHPKVRAVYIVDANPFLKNDKGLWLSEFLLRRNTSGKPVFFELNPEYIKDPRVINNLGRLSKDELAFGVQSTSEHTLKVIKRKFDRPVYERNVRALRKMNPEANIKFSLIVGLPGDDFESFMASLDFVISLEPSDIYVHDLLALPGSEMYEHPERFGITIDDSPPHRLVHNGAFPPNDYDRAKRIGYYVKLLHKYPHVRGVMTALQRRTGRRHIDLYRDFIDLLDELGVDGLGGDTIGSVSSEEFDFRTDRFVSEGFYDHAITEALARLERLCASPRRPRAAGGHVSPGLRTRYRSSFPGNVGERGGARPVMAAARRPDGRAAVRAHRVRQRRLRR